MILMGRIQQTPAVPLLIVIVINFLRKQFNQYFLTLGCENIFSPVHLITSCNLSEIILISLQMAYIFGRNIP